MYVDKQIDILLGGDCLKAVKRALLQVERLDKLEFAMLHLRFLMFASHNLDRLIQIDGLYNLGACAAEVSLHKRMCLDYGLHGLSYGVHVGILRETHQSREVVLGGRRLLHALHVNAHLSVRQRDLRKVGMSLLCRVLRLGTGAHHLGKNLVLNALYCTSLGQ